MKLQFRVRAACLLALLLSALCHVSSVNALTYHFTDSTPLCFSETIDNIADTHITGTYHLIANQAHPPTSVRMSLSVTDPTSKVYYMKKMSVGEHSFSIKPDHFVTPGEQIICFSPNPDFVASESTPLSLRVELDQVQASKPDKDKMVVEGIRKRKQVDGLEVFTFREAGGQLKANLQPRAYLDKIENALISMEFALDKVVGDLESSVRSESRMRQTSESTFTRVWVCALLLIAVISGVLWIEFRFLKSTLRKKKLV
ncbi:putative COP-coated vesicle membrane protein erv25 precursor putative ER--golgi Erv25p [Leptomonas seymouri]|uniref:Putative COP-coated vesicle membrane protein erv25 putative ER--golgi Erv25p n=1 Tax=Leptomonas seymouri TaxID=5684 RepID=A0A0N0P7A9_LEPSE|nr:putative COP-coated vesicle membrane protein erv25 precursor putative ER--golgi Erv25p [Leptomonas seymouri]|eukprot:KPI88579.1 putative COP-coated vesicle membrane protein erv25 precursor putative ER--golgi Erv25p [Leptomonas seymouri]